MTNICPNDLLQKVLEKVQEMAKKGTRLEEKVDFITVLGAIHSEAFIALKKEQAISSKTEK